MLRRHDKFFLNLWQNATMMAHNVIFSIQYKNEKVYATNQKTGKQKLKESCTIVTYRLPKHKESKKVFIQLSGLRARLVRSLNAHTFETTKNKEPSLRFPKFWTFLELRLMLDRQTSSLMTKGMLSMYNFYLSSFLWQLTNYSD